MICPFSTRQLHRGLYYRKMTVDAPAPGLVLCMGMHSHAPSPCDIAWWHGSTGDPIDNLAGQRGLLVRAKQENSNSHESYEYDLFTIGGGSAGVRAARFSADLGMYEQMQVHSKHSGQILPCMQEMAS